MPKLKNMIYNRFSLMVAFQAILIGLNTSLFTWVLPMEFMLVTKLTLISIWILQIYLLIEYVKRTNRDVSRFLMGIMNRDSGIKFRLKREGKVFRELYENFNTLLEQHGHNRLEKEKKEQFFKYTIEHLRTGLLAYDENNEIELHNKALLKLFGIHYLSNLSQLDDKSPGFSEYIRKLQPNSSELKKMYLNGKNLKLSIRTAHFYQGHKSIRLLSIQNIEDEIESSEAEAWLRMIRVLNHEILNSVSPINLLTSSLIENFEEKEDPKNWEDTILALKTIKKRSNGLTRFVESYQRFTRIPDPIIAPIPAKHFLKQICILHQEQIQQKNIILEHKVQTDNLKYHIDEKLIEQVIINLIKNAIQSLEASKQEAPNNWQARISIQMFANDTHKIISISDNGLGINKEDNENIFLPFYTSKKDGTGVGLSMARQIMKMHNGNIHLDSKSFDKTEFRLSFKK